MRRFAALLLMMMLVPVHAAWLEGIRWFRHADYTRVVFDLSAPAEYRVSERLKDGYVDVILQGDHTRRMAEEITIQEGGVLFAKQLRKTSTSLTWRIQVEGMARVRHMSLDEQPYKVAVDFYPAGAGKAAATGASTPAPREAQAAAKPASGSGHGKAAAKPEAKPKTPAKPASKPAAQAEDKSHAAKPGESAHGGPAHGGAAPPRPAGAGGAPEDRMEGLKPDERRRVLVGELLLQLGDSAGAMPYLEQVAALAPSHPWTRFLLAQAYLSKGDQYRAEQLLEPLKGKQEWAALLEGVQRRLHPPDAHGLVPGGDMREEDLAYFLGIIRAGAGLATKDLYAKPEAAATSGGGPSLLLALALGAGAGALVFVALDLRRRRQDKLRERQRILMEDSPRRAAPLFVGEDDADYGAVARRVREELDQVLHKDHGEAPVRPGFGGEPAPAPQTQRGVSLEEQVYQLADQKKSIVEIAEQLNLGVDEVRLHLELREQAGTINNA